MYRPMWPPSALAWPLLWAAYCWQPAPTASAPRSKHARVMMHQPSGAIGGQATDIEITVKEIRKLKRELYDIVCNHSNQDDENVEADFDRDYWMTATEAKEYGLVDEVLLTNPRKEKKGELNY
jgi:ATP-dependent Clp protease protease subunit